MLERQLLDREAKGENSLQTAHATLLALVGLEDALGALELDSDLFRDSKFGALSKVAPLLTGFELYNTGIDWTTPVPSETGSSDSPSLKVTTLRFVERLPTDMFAMLESGALSTAQNGTTNCAFTCLPPCSPLVGASNLGVSQHLRSLSLALIAIGTSTLVAGILGPTPIVVVKGTRIHSFLPKSRFDTTEALPP